MKAKRAAVAAALICGLAAGSLLAATAGDESGAAASRAQPAGENSCRPGAQPTQQYGAKPPEPGLRYATRPIVIGCAELPSGRRFELVGYQLGRGAHTSLCIDDYDLATGVSSGCGSNRVAYGVIDATSASRSRKGPTVVAGTAAASVARVLIHFEAGKVLHEQPAALVNVRKRSLLRAIGVRKPFGRYIAEVPRAARAVSAEARGARGHVRGLAFFDGFGGPLGQGRTCYSRPRIERLRLLEPARAGGANSLRVVAGSTGLGTPPAGSPSGRSSSAARCRVAR